MGACDVYSTSSKQYMCSSHPPQESADGRLPVGVSGEVCLVRWHEVKSTMRSMCTGELVTDCMAM